MNNEEQRPECVGCLYEDEAMKCMEMELAWAWYKLKKVVCPHLKIEAPGPCDLRDVRDGMQ